MAKSDVSVNASPLGSGSAMPSNGGDSSSSSIAGTAADAALFKSLADNSQEFIAMCDLEFRVFYVNEAGCRLVGLETMAEACAARVPDFFFPEDQRFVTGELFPKVRSEGVAEVEIRFRHFKTGAAVWMLHKVLQVHDAQGRVSGYATVSRDITERRQKNEALRESEELFRVMFTQSSVGKAQADPATGHLLRVNPALCAITGYTEPELLRMTFSELTHPEDRSEDHERFARLVSGEIGSYSWEKRYTRKDGEVIWALVTVNLLRDLEGKPLRSAAVIQDITQRKRAEASLVRQRELLQGIIDNIPVLLCIWDPQLKSFQFNRHLTEVLGWTEADTLDGNFIAKVYPDPAYRAQVITYMQSLEGGWRDLRTTARNGSAIDCSWANVGLPDGRMIGIGLDIRQRKRADEELRESEERYRTLFNSISEAFALKEAVTNGTGEIVDFRLLEVNPAFEAQSGLKQVTGRTMREVMPTTEERWIERFAEVVRTGRPVRFQDHVSGLARWFEVFASRVGGDGSRQVAVLFSDVTERRRAEDALHKSEERLRLVTDRAPVLLAHWDPEHRFKFANLTYTSRFGLSPNQVIGKHLREVVGEQAYETIHPWLEKGLRGEVTDYELQIPYSGGKSQCMRVTYTRELGPEGEVLGIIGAMQDLSERKRAEEALRQSESKLRAVIEQAPLAMALTGPSGEILFRNPKFDQLWGRPPHVTTAGTYSDVYEGYHLDGRRIQSEEWPGTRSILKGESIDDEVFEIVHASGQRIPCWFGSVPIRDPAGEILGAVVVFRDITKERRIEHALRENQERQGYLLELGDALRPLRDPVKIQEVAARVLAEHLDSDRALYFEAEGPDYIVERDCARGVGSLRGRFPVANFGSALCEDYQAGRTVVVMDVQTEPGLSPEERQAYAAIQIRAHVGVPLLKGGRLVAGLAVHSQQPRDWTAQEVELIRETAERTWASVERARAEAALRQSEQNYKTLFTSIDEGFCVIEMLFDEHGKPNDWRFLQVNPAFERHNGLVEATGKTIRELAPSIESKWFEIYGKVAVTGQAIRLEEFSEALNRCFDLYAFRVGKPGEHKIAVLFTDITVRRAVERELAQHRQELERLVAERTASLHELVGELEHFSYTITHDMRAPLRAMRGFAEVIQELCAENPRPELDIFLRRLMQGAERMDLLITDALQYTKAVRQDLPLGPVDLGVLLRGMLETYPGFIDAGIELKEPVLPVLGNEAALTQCFSNLIGNAIKFVKPGEKPKVRVWTEHRLEAEREGRGGGWIRIWVEDQGIGISETMRPRLFHMFSRWSRDYDGTGIGLALVRKVVQRMGGRVGVESEEGKGSRFWVELRPSNLREGGGPFGA